MQKLIAKYGLAAHLALLAVAPLFLLPFGAGRGLSTILLWLSAAALLWTFLEPSVLQGETTSVARRRVRVAFGRDPLTWILLAMALVSGIRAVNSGVSFSYDVEHSVWRLTDPAFPILPASVGDVDLLPFAAAVSILVLVQACRHALGRSARLSFLLQVSVLAGIASAVVLVAISLGSPRASRLLASEATDCSCIGLAFGFYLLIAVVTLVSILESEWRSAWLPAVFAAGSGAAGVFSFAPPFVSAGFAVLIAVLVIYSIFYAMRFFKSVSGFLLFLAIVLSIAVAGLLVASTLPKGVLTAKLQTYRELVFFPERFWEIRTLLSGVAIKAWFTHLWVGTGLGSFPLDFRFSATADDWAILPRGVRLLANGWLLVLAERGLVGAVQVILPLGFLACVYCYRLYGSLTVWEVPHPACLLAPFVILIVVLLGLVDCSPFRPEALMAAGPMLVVSAAAYPKKKVERNGG